MGNSSSTPALRRPDFKMLNFHVYELYTPPALGAPELEIIFIHGPHLHDAPEDAFWRTWTTSENECWPQTWLTKEENLPTARILAVSYDASIRKSATHGRSDLFLLAEDIIPYLVPTHREGCPIFIVAHSLGGLVVNQMILLAAADKTGHHGPETFLDDLAGIVYFATPHHGMFLRGSPIAHLSPLMEVAHSFPSKELARLSHYFYHWRMKNRVKTLGFCEAFQTRLGPYFGILVPEASARAHVDDFHLIREDHFGVCAPTNPGSSPALHRLTLFIKKVLAQQDVRAENFQHLPQQIVGIDRAVEEVMAKLDNLEAFSLGVVGKGGIGKTTLVKKVFNILFLRYDYSCFVHEFENIEGGVEAVKKAILQHVQHRRKKLGSADDDLKSLLKGQRLLLVLDHAVPGNIILELVSLLQHSINVDERSRLVVTSRNTQNLSVLGDRNIYPVPPLDGHFATGLFTSLASPESDAPASPQRYLNTIVTKCEGLPLALEVLGNYLHQKSEDIWEEAVRVLDKADIVPDFDERLWAKLRVSYDALKEEEQQMFLDAATIFNGCRLIEAKEVWNFTMKNAEHERWERLVHMSLVWEVAPVGRIDGEYPGKYIGMHEQLRSLGRQIESTVGDNAKRRREMRREFVHRQWNLPSTPVDWDEDPITVERMCDPVKCNDGRTYDRWTIIDHSNMMLKSPFNPALKLDILVDDISLRSLLFHKVPEQEAKFDGRRRDYREAALQNARALQSEDGKEQILDAIKKLNNVLKWAPSDTECQNELEGIRNLPVNRVCNFPPANIPVLNHSDVVIIREREGRHIALIFALVYICVSLYIT